MKLGRFSFCSVPLNETALLVIGGYSGKEAVTNVDVLDTVTGRRVGTCNIFGDKRNFPSLILIYFFQNIRTILSVYIEIVMSALSNLDRASATFKKRIGSSNSSKYVKVNVEESPER